MIKAMALLVALALTGVLVMQWRDWPRPLSAIVPHRSDPGATAGPDQPAGLPTTPVPPEAKETYASVAERPLFRPQRKPEPPPSTEPEPASAAAEASTLDGLDLTAVLISPGETKAWIKEPSNPALKSLQRGDEHAGWSVKAILADRLVFERQGETHELSLIDLTAAQTPPPGAPTPPRPNPSARPTPPRPTPATPPTRPTPPVPRQPLTPRRDLPPGQTPGSGQRGVPPPPSPLQPRPNVSRPLPQRPQ